MYLVKKIYSKISLFSTKTNIHKNTRIEINFKLSINYKY